MSFMDIGGFLAVGALLALVGKGVTSMVFRGGPKAGRKGWRGVFYVTMWAHPLVVGALLGLVPSLPAPGFMGSGTVGSVIWYALAGGFSSTCYNVLHFALQHRAERAKETGELV